MINKICAIIISYNPDKSIKDNINAILLQVDEVVIVDNGSNARSRIYIEALKEKITIIYNEKNLGIATALNVGTRYAIDAGYQWAVTFDQDSLAAPDMIVNLIDALNNCENAEKIAFIGPNIKDPNYPYTEWKWLCSSRNSSFLFKRRSCSKGIINDVTMVITSGALTNLEMIKVLGPFRDDLFIDYVDTEYCLRALTKGYRIIVCCKALLYHRLGDRKEEKILGYSFRPTFHQPFRRYYIARNRIFILKEYAVKVPHWACFDVAAELYNSLRVLMFEDQKFLKFLMSIKGYFDGIHGKSGKLSN
jgi:rhamnosyltransferase